MQQKKKREKWLKTRHRVITAVLKPIIGTYTKIKFGIDVHKFKEQGDRQYLVVMKKDADEKDFIDALRCRNGNLNISLGELPDKTGVML